MIFDILKTSLILGFINLLFALIIGWIYKKDQNYAGLGWWIAAILLHGFHFFTIFLKEILPLDLFADISVNIFMVASALSLYVGFMKFLGERIRTRNFIIFSAVYLLITLGFYTAGNTTVPKALTSLSVAVFSFVSAYVLSKHKLAISIRYTRLLSITLLIYALFFLSYGVVLFLPMVNTTPAQLMSWESLSYFIITICSTMWTFGFVLLINQRLAKDRGTAKAIYDLTINTMPDALLITRLKDGHIVQVNEGFSILTGYSAEEALEKTTLDIDVWADPADRQKFVILLTKTGSVENMEFHFRRKNGKTLIGLLSARTMKLNGEMHILNVVRDITPRKKMEESLRENEEKYRFLTENSGDVIWHINNSYRVDYISPADEEIRGFKREEVVGKPIWSIFNEEGIKLVREKIDHHRQVEQVGNNMNTTVFEIEQRCKDGSWIWTEITAAPHYDKYGNRIGFHGISRDISEKKRLREKLYRQATIDELCQIPNRRHFMALAEKELKRAKRYHHPLTIILFDFDNLKEINDTYGHLAGDRSLVVFSKIVQMLIRDVDLVGRFGGDEFILLLPETDQEQALNVVERIYSVLETSPVIYQEERFSISISSGIASVNDWSDTLEDIFKRADQALYRAKDEGGNNISKSDALVE